MNKLPPHNNVALSATRPTSGLIALLGSLLAIGPLAIDMYLPGLPSVATSFGASPAAAQQTIAAYFFGIAFGQLLYGPLSDRWGRRTPLIAGTVLYALGALGCALTPSIALLCVLRVMQAIGACAGIVVTRAIVRDRFPPQEVVHIFALLSAVMLLSPIVAPMLGGWLLLIMDWRGLFLIQASVGAILAAVVFFRLAESRSLETAARARSESPLRAYWALLIDRRLLGFLCLGASSGAALYVWIAASPDIVIRLLHFSPQHFAYVFAANAVGLIAAAQINSRLVRRRHPESVLKWATLLGLVCASSLAACVVLRWGGAWGILIPVFLVLASLGFTQGNSLAGAINVDPTRSGATASLVGSVGSLAGAAAAALAGIFRDGSARPAAFIIATSLLCSVASLTLISRNSWHATKMPAP